MVASSSCGVLRGGGPRGPRAAEVAEKSRVARFLSLAAAAGVRHRCSSAEPTAPCRGPRPHWAESGHRTLRNGNNLGVTRGPPRPLQRPAAGPEASAASAEPRQGRAAHLGPALAAATKVLRRRRRGCQSPAQAAFRARAGSLGRRWTHLHVWSRLGGSAGCYELGVPRGKPLLSAIEPPSGASPSDWTSAGQRSGPRGASSDPQ